MTPDQLNASLEEKLRSMNIKQGKLMMQRAVLQWALVRRHEFSPAVLDSLISATETEIKRPVEEEFVK